MPGASTGHDGVDGGDFERDGDYSYAAGGGGGGGWVGGAGGRPTVWSATTSDGFRFATCSGYGISGTNHVDDAVATLVSAVTADDAGEDGSVTITYDSPPDTTGATTSVSATSVVDVGSTTTSVSATSAVDVGSTTTVDPSAVAARPVAGTPRYTG